VPKKNKNGVGKFAPLLRSHGKAEHLRQYKTLDALMLTLGVAGLFTLPAASALAGADEAKAFLDVQNHNASFLDHKYLFGDWGGERSRLADKGVTFDLNNIGDFQTDVTGSQTHHATYFGRFRASADINLNKLSDFDGEFFFSGVWQYGQNLSGQYLQVNTLVSSIAGTETYRIDQLWYQQGLFEHRVTVKLGQVAAVNEFGATDFFDILMNDELGYAPNAIFNTKQPFSPAGKPGVIVWGDLSVVTPGLYAKVGVFTADDDPYHPDQYGTDYANDFDHGSVVSFELGYQEHNKNYPGVYKAGINANNLAVYSNPNTGENYRGDFTAYGLAEKTVYHPTDGDGNLELKQGLDLLLEFVGAPGDRNPLQFEVTAGARYTGLIPGRDQDKTGFGVIYSQNGYAYSDANAATYGNNLNGETTLELTYQINPLSWFSLQFDNQFIIDPGGDDQRSGILVLGLRTIFRF
jgi:porin